MAKLSDVGGSSPGSRAGRPRFLGWALRFSVLGLALAAASALADGGRIILKDGFILEGNIQREKEIISEGGTPFKVDKANGFFAVDAGPKSTIFSPKQVLKSEDTSAIKKGDSQRFQRELTNIELRKMPPGVYDKITPWDAKWDRSLFLRGATGQKYRIDQRLTLLTPEYARVDAKIYRWTAYFLTSEMDPEVVKDLLYNHSELKQTGDAKDVDKRFRVVNFFIRAKMLDMAAAELTRIEKDFPAEKERVAARRKEFQKFVVAQFVDLIELANRTGRHNWAQTKLPTVPPESLDESTQTRTRTLSLKYEELNMTCLAGAGC